MTYYEWLIRQVEDIQHPYERYTRLFKFLADTRFRWTHPYDANRAEDGLYLRYMYESTVDERDQFFGDIPPWATLLETLVALAIRCENEIMYDPDEGDRTNIWFWTMMDNAGLSISDTRFDEELAENIVEKIMKNAYEDDGRGGLFPCHFYGSKVSQKVSQMDIWQQMNVFMNEKFPV